MVLAPAGGGGSVRGASCRPTADCATGQVSPETLYTPLTVTFTVCGAPEVAPVWSATTTSKLAAGVAVPSCLKLTLPPSRSAWVNLAAGRPGALDSVTNPLRALETVKTRSLAS